MDIMIFRKVLIFCAVLALASPTTAQSNCVSTSVKVTNTGMKVAQYKDSIAFDESGVEQHFESILPIDDFRPNINTTFSCVDSRGEQGVLGTPGGDMAELSAAINIFINLTDTPFSDEVVSNIFKKFVEKFASKGRPFYFHTSDEKLHKVFHTLEEAGVEPKPTVFPDSMPVDAEVAAKWLDALVIGKNQGCGHVRLAIDQFADYGLDGPQIPQSLIRAFFNYWWPTPIGSPQRSRVKMTIVQGPLDGHAVTIVDSAGSCPGHSPAIPPSHGGSQLFVYHAKAVDEFRLKVLTPFFVDVAEEAGKTLDAVKFYNALKSLQAKQLGATLTYLAPANALPVWAVTLNAAATKEPPKPAPNVAKPQNLANPNARNTAKNSAALNSKNVKA